MPPKKYLESSLETLALGQRIDRDELVRQLQELGYSRVPLVEDRGTFSARGAIVDVYAPGVEPPYRVELDDDGVSRIRTFDPDDQKTAGEVQALRLGPAREVPDAATALERAKRVVRDLCDEMNMPTLQAREITAELDRGSGALISNALLTAYYEQLDGSAMAA